MGKPWLSRAIFASSMGVGLAACTVITGVGDLVVGDAPDASEASAPVPTVTGSIAPPTPARDASDDGSLLGDPDASVVDGCSAAECSDVPAGYQLVALGPRDAACPADFGAPADVVETPSLDPGACTCSCSVTQPPTCNASPNAQIMSSFGPNGAACLQPSATIPARCDGSGFLGPFPANERRYVPVAATRTGGTCSRTAVKDDSKLKTVARRLCRASVVPQCDGKTCAPAVTPYAACIATTGDVPECPAAWPERHLVGASASFGCTNDCGCSVGGNCPTRGRVSYFASADCSGAAGIVFTANNACTATAGSGAAAYASHRYDPDPPTGVGCQPNGAAPPTGPTLAQPTTVCCK
ncbi:MAG: hypothetical protein KIT84_43875 [Labilithrix sp.]|nr:hypothetical protein [Labilithrix sp.]MCW5818017.1 hypothetical protein [Labilithrix sp.]